MLKKKRRIFLSVFIIVTFISGSYFLKGNIMKQGLGLLRSSLRSAIPTLLEGPRKEKIKAIAEAAEHLFQDKKKERKIVRALKDEKVEAKKQSLQKELEALNQKRELEEEKFLQLFVTGLHELTDDPEALADTPSNIFESSSITLQSSLEKLKLGNLAYGLMETQKVQYYFTPVEPIVELKESVCLDALKDFEDVSVAKKFPIKTLGYLPRDTIISCRRTIQKKYKTLANFFRIQLDRGLSIRLTRSTNNTFVYIYNKNLLDQFLGSSLLTPILQKPYTEEELRHSIILEPTRVQYLKRNFPDYLGKWSQIIKAGTPRKSEDFIDFIAHINVSNTSKVFDVIAWSFANQENLHHPDFRATLMEAFPINKP